MCYSEKSQKHHSRQMNLTFPSYPESCLREMKNRQSHWLKKKHEYSVRKSASYRFKMPLLSQNKHGTVALVHLNTDACCKLSLSHASLQRKHILKAFTDMSERGLRNTYCGSKEKKKEISNSYLEYFNNMLMPNSLQEEGTSREKDARMV